MVTPAKQGKLSLADIFVKKFHSINIENYDVYHFEEMTIEGRRYQYRPSAGSDLLHILAPFKDAHCFLSSVPCSPDDPLAQVREVHRFILRLESGEVQYEETKCGGLANVTDAGAKAAPQSNDHHSKSNSVDLDPTPGKAKAADARQQAAHDPTKASGVKDADRPAQADSGSTETTQPPANSDVKPPT